MGYNTTVIILNDHLSDIRSDLEFGQKLAHAIQESFVESPVDMSVAKVITSQHADYETVIVMHGNTGKVLSPYANNPLRVENKDAERILTNLAEMYGYKLVKKSKRVAR